MTWHNHHDNENKGFAHDHEGGEESHDHKEAGKEGFTQYGGVVDAPTEPVAESQGTPVDPDDLPSE